MLRYSSIILCACAWAPLAHAQAHRIDSTEVGALELKIDALAFFKDNEYDGDVVRGYSLPGFRVQPRLSYTPLREVRLEAGMYAIVYEGANKYPSYAFHDIAHWKGNQHQHGAHALPFFRATANLGGPTAGRPQGRPSRTTVVVGDIYGGAAHELVQPLYNSELQLTDDPEAGAQVLVERKRWRSDLWLNWQSYIYEEDTHQEAFTVGWTQRVGTPTDGCGAGSGRSYWGMPLQMVVQHRGGEQDLPQLNLGVQTIANGAVGVDYEWRRTPTSVDGFVLDFRPCVVTGVRCEALALAAYQQSGHLWPFDFGTALWTSATVDLACGLSVRAGLFHAPKNFCSLYGSPFFGTMSLKQEGLTFDGMTAGYWALQYAHTFGGAYTLAAKADGYITRGRAPFSFGVYFNASPSFLLKKMGKK